MNEAAAAGGATRERLRQSEERFRLVVENARDYAILITDTEDRIIDWFPGAEAVFGWTAEEAIGQPGAITFTEEDRERGVPEGELARARAAGVAPDIRWHRRKDGSRVFIHGTVTPLRNATGEIRSFLKIGQDITGRKRSEEHQRTLVAELQHRVRNIIAMIRSIARLTAEGRESVEDYADHLEARIEALARTQALLTRAPGAGVDLQNMLREELLAQSAPVGQYEVGGPDVLISPKAAEVLTLALHELVTNSVKYGALGGRGRIEVRWEMLEGEPVAKLRLRWIETGVDIPDGPRSEGFGTELITRRVPYELDGRGEVEFGTDRLIVTLEFALVPGVSILDAAGPPAMEEEG